MLFIVENYVKDSELLASTLNSIEHLKDEGFDLKTKVITKNEELLSTIRECDKYFCLIAAGDEIITTDFDFFVSLINSDEYDIIKMSYSHFETENFEVSKNSGKPIDLFSNPKFVPHWLYYHVFNKNIFSNCVKSENEALLYELYSYLYTHNTIYHIPSTAVLSQRVLPHLVGAEFVLKKTWYLSFIDDLADKVLSDVDLGLVPLYIQAAVLYLYWARINQNINNSDKHIIDEEYEIFKSALKKYITAIDVKLLKGYGIFNPPKHLTVSLLQLRHAENYNLEYKNTFSDRDVLVYVNKSLFQRASEIVCTLDLVDYDKKNKVLSLEYFIENFVDLSQFAVSVKVNGNVAQTEETYRYKHIKYFGKSAQKYSTFRTTIKIDDLKFEKSGIKIEFILTKDNVSVPLTVAAKDYCARLNSSIKHSYWYFDKKVLMFMPERKGLLLKKGFKTAFFKEIKNLLRLFTDTKSVYLLKLRLLYWLTYPYFSHKTIWLTYDKLYKGGDCGEYLYKYCCKRARKNRITPAYVINGDVDDYQRLKKEGYKPLKYQSLKHLLYYLNSSVVFTTHGGVYNFNGFVAAEIKYFQHLLHHDVACIQHGLTVQQLAHNSNRVFNNMKRYYCASKYEIENLSKPIYGYEDKSVLKLTGIPRYDGLINKDKHKILITPTWRNYIAMPATAKNAAKPYFAGFKKTDYFKIYNELLSDERLIETAKATGYELVYLLHPVVSAQIDDYPQNEYVKILPSLTINYEQILTESSLMVTDYSGVQFDFAYMRKPIVYYHPPKLPPHYKEGGFFYDTMGFGEICTEHKELVDVLCDYMMNNCELKPFYKNRADDFFAYDDLNSCKRIYEDMLEYQKSKK